jgi:hypothetical protein
VAAGHAYLTQGQVRLARLQGQLGSQLGQHRDLELQVAQLEQPANVLSQAQKQGLVVPSNVTDLPQVAVSAPSGSNPSGSSRPVADTGGARAAAATVSTTTPSRGR